MRLVLAALLSLLLAAPARAGEVKLLTAGAFKPVVMALVPEFERDTGHKVTVVNDTAGGLVKRIEAGEPFDLVVMTPQAIEQLSRAGKLAGGGTPLARVGIGVAVRRGAPRPDIDSTEAFRRTIAAARSVAYIDPAAGGSSGVYLEGLFTRLGLAEAVKAKAVLVPGGLVAERVVSGEAEIGIHQISEILAVPGAELVGPLPAELQNYTVYAAALSPAAGDAEAPRALLALLHGPKAAEALRRRGMEPPN